MISMDLDFSTYIAHRRGLIEQRARDGAAYAYLGERKLRRALVSAKPVAIALEATSRLWTGKAKSEVLGKGVKANDVAHSQVFNAAKTAAERLGLPAPAIIVLDDFPEPARALGIDDDPIIVLRASTAKDLSVEQLIPIIGHELGHIQNDHVPYATALFYLQHQMTTTVRWIVQPATLALKAWRRRAEISCDRAALLAARDLPTALSAVTMLALPNANEAERNQAIQDSEDTEKPGSKLSSLLRGEPDLATRLIAMRWFAESKLFNKVANNSNSGLKTEDVDAKVGERMGPL